MAESEKFLRLLPGKKRLVDTIRMIAYRAETAMVQLIMRVHNSSRTAANKYLTQLFEHLNQTQIDYPGTDLR